MPRRVFTLSQVKYAIDRLQWLYKNRKLVGGLKFYEEPPVLRFFGGKLKPTSPWPQKLVAKFRADLGDSLYGPDASAITACFWAAGSLQPLIQTGRGPTRFAAKNARPNLMPGL